MTSPLRIIAAETGGYAIVDDHAQYAHYATEADAQAALARAGYVTVADEADDAPRLGWWAVAGAVSGAIWMLIWWAVR